VTERLSERSLDGVPAIVARPAYDRTGLGVGIVHLGPGAFHRAHQGVFTDDAIAAAGGDWGVLGVSLRRGDARTALEPQDGLYTVEFLDADPSYRVIGALRGVLCAPDQAPAVIAAFAAATTQVITLTITEAGYALDGAGSLDVTHPDIAHDLVEPWAPRSAIGWLALGLGERMRRGGAPVTVISCDNLLDNGRRLARAVLAFADRLDPSARRWIEANASFPATMVDCITPTSDEAHCERVRAALGLDDLACVQRERFAQWVIEDRFAGPAPAWARAGVEIVADVSVHERLKLHVLNAGHSALAYLGLPLGHAYVRQAIADPALASFVDRMVAEEIAPALATLPTLTYWRTVHERFANPMLDHRLAQIAEDGSAKLAQRVLPVLIDNARRGRPTRRLAKVVRAWLALVRAGGVRDAVARRLDCWSRAGGDLAAALDDPALFPPPFRVESNVRAAILDAGA